MPYAYYTSLGISFPLCLQSLGWVAWIEPGLPRVSLSGLVPTVATATPCLPKRWALTDSAQRWALTDPWQAVPGPYIETQAMLPSQPSPV